MCLSPPPLLCPTSLKLRMAIEAFVLHVTTRGVVVVRLAMVVCGGGGSVLRVELLVQGSLSEKSSGLQRSTSVQKRKALH